MDRHEHWQGVYLTKQPTEVSWYTAHLEESLRLLREVASPTARVIDVGAGASTLVDDLLALGYRDVTVLDVSNAALDVSRTRLGERAALVEWLAADVTTVDLGENRYDVWHDRAVFHFLTDASNRRAYVERLRRSVVPGGRVILATFSLEGPTKCSGLDVVRYDAESLSRELGDGFALTTSFTTVHRTPAEREQSFVFCRFEKRT